MQCYGRRNVRQWGTVPSPTTSHRGLQWCRGGHRYCHAHLSGWENSPTHLLACECSPTHLSGSPTSLLGYEYSPTHLPGPTGVPENRQPSVPYCRKVREHTLFHLWASSFGRSECQTVHAERCSMLHQIRGLCTETIR